MLKLKLQDVTGMFRRTTYGPIGVDLGTRSVKLVQFSADGQRLVDAVRWELPVAEETPNSEELDQQLIEALKLAREGRQFRGREAVACLGARDLFVQNIRVPKASGAELEKIVRQEAGARLPFPAAESELRFLDGVDVRQQDLVKREVIVIACHQPALARMLQVVEAAGLRPVAVDAEPMALLRCYAKQFRRDEDRVQRAMFVHVGAARTAAIIAEGASPLFIKYLELGGRQMDDAVARHLKLSHAEATQLRRHNGDRRADQQNPEITHSVAESLRPVADKLAAELSMCIRYHSVTFRGQPLARLVLGGGEANSQLLDSLQARLDIKCELGDPLRSYEVNIPGGRRGQWDVAVGLALRELG
jgi:type IV pilus assembly protein PilM